MKKYLLCVLCWLLGCGVLQAEATGEILTFPANPSKGFQWGYALYLPQTMNPSQKLPILLTMNNSGTTATLEESERKALKSLRRNRSVYQIPDELGVPLVMPLVQREERNETKFNPTPLYTHELNRATFVSQDPQIKQLDEQVLAMLQDARKQLKKRGIKTEKKFLVAGFSAAGAFAWRWTMLHPNYVLAATVGGDHYPMLPLETWNGIDLIYPVGVFDFKKYTGKSFNRKAWLKVPILVTNGAVDLNDPLPYDECFSPTAERPVLQQVLPEETVPERMKHSFAWLTQLAPNVQAHLYPNLDHEPVTEDVIAFLKQHLQGGPLHPISLKDTSRNDSSLPVRVLRAYWGFQAPIINDREYLDKQDLILQTDGKRIPYWVWHKYKIVSILSEGKVLLTKNTRGIFGNEFLQISFTDEDVALLKKTGKRTFEVRAVEPEVVDIPANLTFTLD